MRGSNPQRSAKSFARMGNEEKIVAQAKHLGTQIRQMIADGKSNSQICAALGVSAANVSYHAKQIGMGQKPRPKYAWAEVQAFIDAGNSIAATRLKFGMSKAAIDDARNRGAINYETLSTAEAFAATIVGKATSTQRNQLRTRLVREGRELKCEICSLTDWQEKPITLHLDHIDGDGRHNHPLNLRFLCPNCHSQTETYGGRNAGTYAASRETPEAA